jgi:hypothetical protein
LLVTIPAMASDPILELARDLVERKVGRRLRTLQVAVFGRVVICLKLDRALAELGIVGVPGYMV